MPTVRKMLGHIGSKRMWAAFMQPEGKERKEAFQALQNGIIISELANSNILCTC